MKVSVTELSVIQRSMEVTVDSETVDKSYDKAFKKALKMLALPGFRRGKVPAYMGRKYISNELLKRDVLEEIIPDAFDAALKQEKLELASAPEYTDIKGERGEELVFTAKFEVLPVIDIKDYEGVKVTVGRYTPTDEDVTKTVDRIVEAHTTLEDVTDRALQADDVAYVDYVGTEDGKPVEGGEAKDFPMNMKPDSYFPGFLDNLFGMKIGETREFDATYPAEHKSPLAGRTIHFNFKLNAIKQPVRPELTADFLKMAAGPDITSVEQLRERILNGMNERINADAEQHVAEKVYFAIASQIGMDVIPKRLIAKHAYLFNNRVMENLKAEGGNFDDMLKAQGITREDWAKHVELMGLGEARLEIIVKNLARQLEMSIDDEELNTVIDEEAAKVHQTSASLRDRMEKNGYLELMRYALLRDKVTQHLVDKADVTYKSPEEVAAEEAAEAAAKAEKEKAEAPAEEKSEEAPAEETKA